MLCVFISSCSQILLKKGSSKENKGIYIFLNKNVIIGYSIFFLITLLVAYLYKYIDLSVGAVLDSSGYIFISVLSYIFLKETISKKKMLGIFVIIIGILICVL